MAQKNYILVNPQNRKSDVKLCDDTCFPFTAFTNTKEFIKEFFDFYCEKSECPNEIIEKGLVDFVQAIMYDPKSHSNKQSEMSQCISKIGPILDNFYRFKLKEHSLISNRNVEVNHYIRFPDKKTDKPRAGGKKPDFFLQQEPNKDVPMASLWYLHEEKIEEKQLKNDFVKLCNLARAALDW